MEMLMVLRAFQSPREERELSGKRDPLTVEGCSGFSPFHSVMSPLLFCIT